ncbi:hypothetical protein EBU99_08085 [bacterium]|nr:hypothetical protein [bacterium]
MQFSLKSSVSITLLFAAASLFATACKSRRFGESGSSPDSLADPHKLPATGPWFEGWYVRMTPTSGTDRSLGAIVGSYLPPGERRSAKEETGLSGYAAILDGGSAGSALRSFEAFPNNSRLFLNTSDAVNRDPAPGGPASFRWASEGVGEFTAEGLNLNLPDGASLKARWHDVAPWSASGLGPEGIISLFRAFPLHWFVYSVRSKVDFDAVLPDPSASGKFQHVTGSGFAHFEKNWGVAFPASYVWMQAYNSEQNRSLALAGGTPIRVGPDGPEAWLVGYRSALYNQDFAPQNIGTFYESVIDGCKGSFSLTSSFLDRRLVVTAQAERPSFGGIAIPKESGFEKNGSEQSFQTKITAQLFEVTPLSPSRAGDRLLEQTVFAAGALEFGAGYKCPNQQ